MMSSSSSSTAVFSSIFYAALSIQRQQQRRVSSSSSSSLLFIFLIIINFPIQSSVVNGQSSSLSCLPSDDSTCNSTNDGICDSNLATTIYGSSVGVIKPGCELSDCYDCDLCRKQYDYNCNGCLQSVGCVWCPYDGTCRNSPDYYPPEDGITESSSCVTPSDYIFAADDGGGVATCTVEGNFFSDPLYSGQQWVFDIINVEDVWQQGKFGSNIKVRINDRGIDHINPEFRGRFDISGSCTNNFRPSQTVPFPPQIPSSPQQQQDDDDIKLESIAIQNHGTGVASIIGATFNNDICSVGIAPLSSLSSCNIFTLLLEQQQQENDDIDDIDDETNNDDDTYYYDYLIEKLDTLDISQNSYGLLPTCGGGQDDNDDLIITRTRKERLEQRQRGRQRRDTNNDDDDDENNNNTNNNNIFDHHDHDHDDHRRRKLLFQECPFTQIPSNPNPCDVCGDVFTTTTTTTTTTTLTQECQSSIMNHCLVGYESDRRGCLAFLDYLIILGGSGSEDDACGDDYNRLPISAIESFSKGIALGRDGKGVIYVFPSGNKYGNDVNFGGITNSRFTISVGSVDKNSFKTSYTTPSSAVLVSAPGGDSTYVSNHVGASFSGNGQGSCGSIGYGSDLATPVVSGVIALMLEANPALTWRDVQGILALSSSNGVLNHPDDSTATTNAAGYNHSNYYGFGIINAAQAVALATDWENLPPEQFRIVESSGNDLNLAILPTVDGTNPTTTSLTLNISNDEEFVLESVAVQLFMPQDTFLHKIEISLISPLGTASILHPADKSYVLQIKDSLKLSTLKNYGENPTGEWTLQVRRIPQQGIDTSQCVDFSYYTLFAPSEDLPPREITCQYLESEGFCIDGTINEDSAKFGNPEYQPLLGITTASPDGAGNLEYACCACGGGILTTADATPITLNKWRLVVYGYDVSETTKPSETPSEQPSEQPSEVPSQQPSPVGGAQQPTKQPTKAPTQPRFPTTAEEGDEKEPRSKQETRELIITIVASVAVLVLIAACCYHAVREPPQKDFSNGKSPRSNASTEII